MTPYTNYVSRRSSSATIRRSSTASRRKFDNIWTDTTNYSGYANVDDARARRIRPTRSAPDMNFPPAQDYAERAVKLLQRRDAEDRRDDVPRHRPAAHRRDDRRARTAASRSATSARRTSIATRPAVGRVEHGPDVRGRHSDARPRHRRREPREADAALRPGDDDLRVVELDRPSAEFAAGAQLLHEQELDVRVVPDQFKRKWNNRSAGVAETEPFVPLPPDKPAYQSIAERRGRRRRRPVRS